MEIDLVRSPIDSVGLALLLAASILMYKKNKNSCVLLMSAGFFLVLFSTMAINFCTGLLLSGIGIDEYAILCNPITPYIRGLGYLLAGLGLFYHARKYIE